MLKPRNKLPLDETSKALLEAVRNAYREVMREDLGRELTEEEEMAIINEINEVKDLPESPEEYEFDTIAELVQDGMSLEKAEKIAKEETRAIYEAIYGDAIYDSSPESPLFQGWGKNGMA